MAKLTLYSHPDCHLCEEGEALLHREGLGDSFRTVDIETDLELLKKYEIHVPVLKRGDTGEELFWPFDSDDLAAFLGNGS